MAGSNQAVKEDVSIQEAYRTIFTALRALLRDHQGDFVVTADKPNHCCLETRALSLNGRRMLFASAKIKKNYVSYYLPPLYMFPELASRISPGLRGRLQGQSCFNFTALDRDCLAELKRLTQAGFLILKSKALL